MTPTEIADLSDEALAAEWDRAATAALDARTYAKTLGAEVERRQLAAEAAARIANLSDPERAALAQVLRPVGIESGEAHGE